MPLIDDLELTLLPLDNFRRNMGIDPYHFWQFEHPSHPISGCTRRYVHERWQSMNIARLDMLTAIMTAERNVAKLLRWWPAPKYIYREKRNLKHPQLAASSNIRPRTIHTEYSKVQSVGIQTWTLLDDNVDVVYDTTDNVVLTLAVAAGIVASEIVVTYPGSQVRIRPINVSIAAGVATITIKKWLMADPALWEVADLINATDTDNLLSVVDIYRVYIDVTEQVLVYWEPIGTYSCTCLNENCPICSGCTQNACAINSDYNLGIVGWQLATYATGAYTAAQASQCRYPDSAYISYVSGADLDGDRDMSSAWQRLIAHYGVALMDMPVCDCSDVHDNFNYWQVDLGVSGGPEGYQYPQNAMEGPLGSLRRGAIEVWNVIRREIEL